MVVDVEYLLHRKNSPSTGTVKNLRIQCTLCTKLSKEKENYKKFKNPHQVVLQPCHFVKVRICLWATMFLSTTVAAAAAFSPPHSRLSPFTTLEAVGVGVLGLGDLGLGEMGDLGEGDPREGDLGEGDLVVGDL